MEPSKLISKTNASFPEYLDFQKFRKKGIEHCQALASDLWTDFNLHDPGITILEVLCYALTDLGYRANFPIADMLARSPEQIALDKIAAGSDGKLFDDNFFTAEQILTCNPITMFDLRKLLIDVPGVSNAWIERTDAVEPAIYLNDKKAELQYQTPKHLNEGDESLLAKSKVTPDGLYVVYLELDEDLERDDDPERDAGRVDAIIKQVWKLLHRHRNLCEDFLDVEILGDEEVALCIDIEIKASADPADVLLAMYLELAEFLAPTLTFYSLQEMLARGKRIEEIYAGRPLTPLLDLIDGCPGACSHGFIDVDELKQTERRVVLHASDLYQIVMQLPGVLAVRKLMMVNYINGKALTRGEKWCLHLRSNRRQRFDLQRSQITLFKELLPFPVNEETKETVQKRFKENKRARAKAPLESYQLDRLVPEGKYRSDLQDFRSIVHEFPPVYGIGEGEIPKSAPIKRKAQVHQLRAYLLFYDQILANYLAQLTNLRELFSMRSDDDKHRLSGGKNRTYFTQILKDIPGIDDLLRNYQDATDGQDDSSIPDNYLDHLNDVAESRDIYRARRNRFLDHLLARFAESFTDYVLLMYDINGRRNDDERSIRDKTGFLVNYPETSRDRGKGFDYSDCKVWNTNNVSGLEKRVARLLSLGSVECESEPIKALVGERFLRRTLSHVDVKEVNATWRWSIELKVGGGDSAKLRSRLGYENEAAARAAIEVFHGRARELSNYWRLNYTKLRHFGFGILKSAEQGESDKNLTMLATFPQLFPPSDGMKVDAERDAVMNKVADFFAKQSESSALLDINILLENANYFFIITVDIPEVGTTEFRSLTSYSSQAEANQAATTFIAQAAKLSAYKKFSRDGFVHYGFTVVDEDGSLLAEAGPWPTSELRDRYLFLLVQLAIGGNVRCEFFQLTDCHSEGAYRVDLQDPNGEVLLAGTEVFASPEQAGEACNMLLELARHRKRYRTTTDGAKTCPYSLELLDENGTIVARDPRYFRTLRLRDKELRRIVDLVRSRTPRCVIHGTECGHYFRLVGGTHMLISTSRYPDAAHAASACTRVLARLTDSEAYTIQGAEEGKHRLVVSDADGIAHAISELSEPDALEVMRDDFIALAGEVTPLPHTVEQTESGYRCRLTGAEGRLFLESVELEQEEKACEKVWEGCNRLVELAQHEDNFRRVTATDTCMHGFELMNIDRQTVAKPPVFYATSEERDAQIQAIVCLANAEGFHLVEHLLLRPKNSGSVEGQEDVALLPLGSGCRDIEGKISPVKADPYSFRATVVVPYWPRRFRDIEFRRFFERTLRMETPAHVFLRICWVDACQMRTFERAYRWWLCALAHSTTDCEAQPTTDCEAHPMTDSDRAAAHNALVDILFQLKSVHRSAGLFDCTQDSDAQPIILDQTILGTAGTDHDDTH
ncbi:MAG: hypothetical protein DHS20C01_31190 [marine bacterium B5-7]|nr:MAG: hypothetical protein DHS20C01_31190 [marine bacterium B5-7]